MKTSNSLLTETNNQQPRTLCENQLSSSSFSLPLWPERGLSMQIIRKKVLALVSNVGSAGKGALVGLAALILSIGANNRIYAGLVLMGVVAPLSSCFYMMFNRFDVDKVWYHVSYYYLFFLLAPSLFVLACLIGVWLLFPRGSKRAYALVVPTGYTLGKILWYIQVSSNEEFHSILPISFVGLGCLISFFFFVALDWLAHNKFHRKDAFDARYDGLAEVAGDLEPAKVVSMLKSIHREKKAFQKQY